MPKSDTAVILDAEEFRLLVAGATITKLAATGIVVTVALKDVGFGKMRSAVNDAQHAADWIARDEH